MPRLLSRAAQCSGRSLRGSTARAAQAPRPIAAMCRCRFPAHPCTKRLADIVLGHDPVERRVVEIERLQRLLEGGNRQIEISRSPFLPDGHAHDAEIVLDHRAVDGRSARRHVSQHALKACAERKRESVPAWRSPSFHRASASLLRRSLRSGEADLERFSGQGFLDEGNGFFERAGSGASRSPKVFIAAARPSFALVHALGLVSSETARPPSS